MPDNENDLIKKVIAANKENVPLITANAPPDDDSEDEPDERFKPIPLSIIPPLEN